MPNIALPRPRPIRQIRRPGTAVPVVPIEVAAPEIIEAAGIHWIQIGSPRAADRGWLQAQGGGTGSG